VGNIFTTNAIDNDQTSRDDMRRYSAQTAVATLFVDLMHKTNLQLLYQKSKSIAQVQFEH